MDEIGVGIFRALNSDRAIAPFDLWKGVANICDHLDLAHLSVPSEVTIRMRGKLDSVVGIKAG